MNQITLKGFITKLSFDDKKARFGLAYSIKKATSKEQTTYSFETCYIQTSVFNKFLLQKFNDNEFTNGSQVIVSGKLGGYKNQQGNYINTITANELVLLKIAKVKPETTFSTEEVMAWN